MSNIQNGKYILPKAEVCIDSIQKFDEQVVINKIEEVIIKLIINSMALHAYDKEIR